MIRIYPVLKPAACFFMVLLSLLLTACQTVSPAIPSAVNDASQPADVPAVQVIRYGRYTLVELMPEHGQRNLMAQIVDVNIPYAKVMSEVTVGDALRYVLLRSGFRLCDISEVFDELPLPVAHAHLGPIELRDALTVLAGPAWKLQVNETTRQVCFVSVLDVSSAKTGKEEASK